VAGREYQSYSSLSTYQRCPRLYRHQYVEGYRETLTNLDVEYGRAWHGAMEEFNSGANTVDCVESARGTGAQMAPGWWKQLSASLEVYAKLYGPARDRLKTVAVEAETSFSWAGHTYKCVFDALVQDHKGEFAILEHKTTKSDITEGSFYWVRKLIDHQTELYMHAARSAGYPVSYVIYDVTKRVTKKKLAGETYEAYDDRIAEHIRLYPSEVFRREILRPTDAAIKNSVADLDNVSRQIDADRVFSRSPSRCLDYGRLCVFSPVCREETPLVQLQGVRKT